MTRTRDAQRYRKVYSYTRPTPRIETVMGSVATTEDILRLDWKDSVVVASTTHVPLSGGVSLTVDGVSLSTSESVRVLLFGQSSSIDNGIYDYVWNSLVSSYSMTRSDDAVQGMLSSMAAVAVETGTSNGGWGFLLTTSDPITVGSTSLTWRKTFGQGSAIFVSTDSPSKRAKTDYAASFDPEGRYSYEIGTDVVFFVSGSTSSGATSVFGGSLKSSGSITAVGGISGSLTRLSDGTSFMVAGSNVTITSASNGQITISSTGGGGSGSENYFGSSLAGSVYGTGSLALVGLSGLTSSYQIGSNVYFYVSGTVGDVSSSSGRMAVFGGDVVSSGSIKIGSNYPPFASAVGETPSGGGVLVVTGREIRGLASSSSGPELRMTASPGTGTINLGPTDYGASGGGLSLRGGSSVAVTGSVADGGSGGYVEILSANGGDCEDGTAGSGGYVSVTAGSGGSASTGTAGAGGTGGDMTLSAGSGGSAASAGKAGSGGTVNIYGGNAGDRNDTAAAGTPGNINIEAGFGSFNNNTFTFGPRGDVTILGSTIDLRSENAGNLKIVKQTSTLGGNVLVTAGTHSTGSHSQVGGSVIITSGDGKLTDGSGGDVVIRTGIGHGTGSDGNVTITAGSGSSPGVIQIGASSQGASYITIGHSTVRSRMQGGLELAGDFVIAGADLAVITSSYQMGTDNFVFVSGTVGLAGSSARKTVFGGDVVVSGSLTVSGSSLATTNTLLPMTRNFYGVSGLQTTTSDSWTTIGIIPFDPRNESPNLTGSTKTLSYVVALQILTASVTASIRLLSKDSGVEINSSLITGTSAGLSDVEILSSSLTIGADPDVLTGSNSYKVQLKRTGGLSTDQILCYAGYMSLKWTL